MVSLQDFPAISRFDEVSICERDGRLCTLPVAEFQRSDGGASGVNFDKKKIQAELFQIIRKSFTQLSLYPVINIHRDLYNIPTAATGLRGGDDPRKILIMPTNETLVKRLARTYFEDGFFETLNEAEKDSQAHPIVGALASHLKRLVDGALRLNTFFWPYARGQGAGSLTKFSETRYTNRCGFFFDRFIIISFPETGKRLQFGTLPGIRIASKLPLPLQMTAFASTRMPSG